MILYCAADLVWATRIKSTADALGVPCRPVRTVEMLRARLAEGQVRAVILDLETPETSLAILRALRAEQGGPGRDPDSRVHVLAFGPHVATELFQQAREAGADQVLARGAFDRSLAEILQGLNAPPRA